MKLEDVSGAEEDEAQINGEQDDGQNVDAGFATALVWCVNVLHLPRSLFVNLIIIRSI